MILCKPERTEGVYPEDSFRLNRFCVAGASRSRLTPLRVSLSSDRIPVLLEDLYTQVAFRLPWIMLKCISKPFDKIEFLGARTRPSILMWKHTFYFIRCIFLKDWRRGRLYPAISHIRPKKWYMKDIVNLKCIWQLHAVCYDPNPLDYPKRTNPPW